MRHDIDHLPSVQLDELDRVKQLLMGEFAEATARATQPWKKNGRILKVILFGSYARDDWVDEPENGYQSDYDLLVVVSHPDLTDIADYWYVAEEDPARHRNRATRKHHRPHAAGGEPGAESGWVFLGRYRA